MIKRLNTVTAVTLMAWLTMVAGCGSTSATRIDPGGAQTITTVRGLDIQDATDAAATLSTSLLESGVLGKGGKPSTIAISKYINDTGQQIDRDQIIKKIRVTLNKAGVAQTYTTISVGGPEEDPLATNQQKVDSFLNDKQVKPDYSLTFKLLRQKAEAGKVRQVTYTFQMSLTDLKTGLATWEDETQITKQGKQSTVGW